MPFTLIILVLVLVFWGLGLAMIIVAQVSKKKAQAAQALPTTPGQIISSQVLETRAAGSKIFLIIGIVFIVVGFIVLLGGLGVIYFMASNVQ